VSKVKISAVDWLLKKKEWKGAQLVGTVDRLAAEQSGNCKVWGCAVAKEQHVTIVAGYKRGRAITETRHLIPIPHFEVRHPSGATAYVRTDVVL